MNAPSWAVLQHETLCARCTARQNCHTASIGERAHGVQHDDAIKQVVNPDWLRDYYYPVRHHDY